VLDAGPVGAHAVAVAVDLEDGGSVRSRSSMAAATMGASKIWPQAAMPRLVVSTIEPLR
jgi:hypothetical protein